LNTCYFIGKTDIAIRKPTKPTRRIESVSVSFDLMPKIAFKKFKELVNFDNLLKMKEFFSRQVGPKVFLAWKEK
jgi:hypothetical protein